MFQHKLSKKLRIIKVSAILFAGLLLMAFSYHPTIRPLSAAFWGTTLGLVFIVFGALSLLDIFASKQLEAFYRAPAFNFFAIWILTVIALTTIQDNFNDHSYSDTIAGFFGSVAVMFMGNQVAQNTRQRRQK